MSVSKEWKRSGNLAKAKKDMMKHFNGHMPCAIDTETTGLRHGYHSLWQAAFVVLDGDFQVNKDFDMFDMLIIPRDNFENYDPRAMNQEQIDKVKKHGIDADKAGDLFYEWFQRLNLPHGKRLIPIAQNWCFDKPFLQDWLGFRMIDECLEAQYGDLIPITRFINDLMGFQSLQVPFPRYSLGSLCGRLQVTNVNPHDALADAVATAGCYRQIIKLNSMLGGIDKFAAYYEILDWAKVQGDMPKLIEFLESKVKGEIGEIQV